jgi:peptidoglycan hydrolase CwlO-like protein
MQRIIFFLLLSFMMIPQSLGAASDCLSYDLKIQRSDDELRKILAICDAESKETEAQLKKQQAKSSTIASDVAYLDSLIKKAAQQITIKNEIIKQLGTQITQKVKKIETLSEKIDREHDSLEQIMRKKNEIDTTTLTEMLLSKRRVSEFFLDVDNFSSINKALQGSLNTIRGVRVETSTEKENLEKKKLEQANLKNQIEADKRKTESQQADKKTLLASSKNQEANYQKLLSEKKAQAAKVSAALFKFRGGQGIPFGDAYRYAQTASRATGVETAFILAILKQESNFGKYDGGCVLIDKSGTGKRLSNGEIIPNVMKPTRDLQPFLDIVSDLGFDYREQQFSCPITAKKSDGKYSDYGGALGPSQFIPSTWLGVKDRIEAALNVPHANPWNPEHAIMATAIYMKDLGAQNKSSQRDAACKYYSGRGCNVPGVQNAFYGNSVMNLKISIQRDIDIIEAAR